MELVQVGDSTYHVEYNEQTNRWEIEDVTDMVNDCDNCEFRDDCYEEEDEYVEDYIPAKIIYNDNCTVVYWKDGSKTTVKCGEGEVFSKEVGLAMATTKKIYGTRQEFLRMVNSGYEQPTKDMKKFKKLTKEFFSDNNIPF